MLIKTERLLIRFPKIEDLASSMNIWLDPMVTQFSGGPASSEDINQGFLNDLQRTDPNYGFQSVAELNTGQHIVFRY